MKIKVLSLALMSGCFGTAGSVFGKLASSIDIQSWLILYVIMIIFNTICNLLFVNSLVNSPSSTPPTVVSVTSNYFSSALAGVIFFEETVSFIWWCGTSLVLAGLALICMSSCNEDSKSKLKKKSD